MLKIISCISIILLIAILIVVIESIREHKKFKVTRYKISNEKIPDEFKNTKLLVLSDLHNAFYGKENEKLFNKIRELKPDFIILAGDMPVANTKNAENNIKTAKSIIKLSETADVFYGIGNHEKRMMVKDFLKDNWDEYYNIVKNHKGTHDFYIMNNKKIEIEREDKKINIYGLDLELSYYQRFSRLRPDVTDIEKSIGKPDKDKFNMLIAHNPEYFDIYEKWGADLTFSGHVHGGMIRLPVIGGVISPKPRLFPHYDYGKYEKNGRIMLLSSGIGSHSVKIRFNNIPEILLVELI